MSVLAIAQPVFLLLAWKFNIAPTQITTATDLASIMGAIFAAGGLVVALVSIYTMANVQSVAQNAVEPLLADIPKQIESRIERALDAYTCFTQAKERQKDRFSTLDEIEELIDRALTLEPMIRGVCAWTGEQYHATAGRMYAEERAQKGYLGRLELPDGTEEGLPDRETFPALIAKAASWLERAYARHDGDQQQIAMQLAEVYGMMHSPSRATLHWLGKAAEGGRQLPIHAYSLLYLFGSCHDQSDREKLRSALKIESPLSANAIKLLVESRAAGAPLPLIVMPRNERRVDDPVVPGIVYIYPIGDGKESALKGQALWFLAFQPGRLRQRVGIPPIGAVDATGVQPQADPIPIDELLKAVVDRFYVVSQAEWWLA